MSTAPEPYFRGINSDASEWRDRDDQHALRYEVVDLNITATLTRDVMFNGTERAERLVSVIECRECGAILRTANRRKHERFHGRVGN
ncbi:MULTISPECIES: hypothetical protein [unclassified Microbacterium]|uniref:hypothetical protein n=1 Tax=unclassified Microbacterium TaxID=2609290 RepID=UPI000EA91984|nr:MULTISPECIES: hypothetical protein [unclassified Microbacterium]MBT2484802.1 hypothetical protein [Microbacterium sp. ISL-108]RKN67675.1 hypothetical protein D7252_08810 [Microbacterium sp. CGR2]